MAEGKTIAWDTGRNRAGPGAESEKQPVAHLTREGFVEEENSTYELSPMQWGTHAMEWINPLQ